MQRIKLPKIDKIANAREFQNCLRPQIIKIAQELIRQEREKALQGGELASESEIIARIKSRYEKFQNLSLKPLINATGVVLHTNLGRSVISAEILARAQKIITSYSNLEYDLSEGTRGNRYDYIALLCSELFGAQDALVVNNNAAAVFLVLNTFARGREAVVSRGELVEIGGSFRVSEVMANSGAKLTEIGTTNKTKLDDYEEAINENTAILMKVHRSNFKISGFSSSVSAAEVAALARKATRKKEEFLALREANFKNLADLCGGSSDTDGKILNFAQDVLSLATASANALNLNSGEPSVNSECFYESGTGEISDKASKIAPAKFSMKKEESFNEIIDYYDLGSGYASELGFHDHELGVFDCMERMVLAGNHLDDVSGLDRLARSGRRVDEIDFALHGHDDDVGFREVLRNILAGRDHEVGHREAFFLDEVLPELSLRVAVDAAHGVSFRS